MAELKTPDEWCAELGARVMDPDGWRGSSGRDWNDPISREEFDRRLATCTIDSRGYPTYLTLGEDAMTTPDERPPFRLADEEVCDLMAADAMGWDRLLEAVTDLCASYRDQGLVEGDLAHDGTIRAEVAAVEPRRVPNLGWGPK